MNKEKVLLGYACVDSGQLIITDPCYLKDFKTHLSDEDLGYDIYRHVKTGKLWSYVVANRRDGLLINEFPCYSTVIEEYGKTPNELIESGEFILTDIDPTPHISEGEYSYRGTCKLTSNKNQGGQLKFNAKHAGAGVAFKSGYGDGEYPVYAEYNEEGVITRVIIEFTE